MSNPITAWSYSRLSLYEECPARFKYKNIDRLPEPKSPAMDRGIAIHETLAKWMKSDEPLLPADAGKKISDFNACALELRAMRPIVEQEWGFNRDMRATGWFGKDTYYRATLDVCAADDGGGCTVVDWKTGKQYGSNADQMEQFAMAVFARYYDVQEVDTRLWYVDTGDETQASFFRKDFAAIKAKWEERVKPMFTDTVFAPRPNSSCRFCHFRKSNGGPCVYG